jgi:hypothetical protein
MFSLISGIHIPVTDTSALNMALESVYRTPRRHKCNIIDENLTIKLSCVPDQQRVWVCILSLTAPEMCTQISNIKRFQQPVYDPGSLIGLIPQWQVLFVKFGFHSISEELPCFVWLKVSSWCSRKMLSGFILSQIN